MAEETYNQVQLDQGNTYQVTWIPTTYAQPGTKLSLLRDAEPRQPWTVTAVYQPTRTKNHIRRTDTIINLH